MGALLTPRKLALDKGKPKARTDCEDRFERSLLAGCWRYCFHAFKVSGCQDNPAGNSKVQKVVS